MDSSGWPDTVYIATTDTAFSLYRHEPGDPNSPSDDSILDVLKDRAGILWVGTAFGGLDRLDPASGAVTHYRHDPGNERSLSNNNVACLYQDHTGSPVDWDQRRA